MKAQKVKRTKLVRNQNEEQEDIRVLKVFCIKSGMITLVVQDDQLYLRRYYRRGTEMIRESRLHYIGEDCPADLVTAENTIRQHFNLM